MTSAGRGAASLDAPRQRMSLDIPARPSLPREGLAFLEIGLVWRKISLPGRSVRHSPRGAEPRRCSLPFDPLLLRFAGVEYVGDFDLAKGRGAQIRLCRSPPLFVSRPGRSVNISDLTAEHWRPSFGFVS